jgi:hypothetical protein
MLRNESPTAPHLVLFFDLNDTIIMGDIVQNITTEDALLKLLAEHYSAVWCVGTEAMTYRQYIETYLCPGSNKNPDIKKQRMEFYRRFLLFLQATHHPLRTEIESTYSAVLHDMHEGDVFKSVINLIQHLTKLKQPFTIVLRTFGEDGPRVMDEIQKRSAIKFTKQGHFDKDNLLIENNIEITHPQAMLEYFEPHQHVSIRDHYEYWHNAEGSYISETYERGKQHLISFDNADKLMLFFDDNYAKQILRVRPVSDAKLDQPKIQAKLVELGRIVEVPTLEAFKNPQYYVERVQFALQHAHVKLNESDFVAPPLSTAPGDELVTRLTLFASEKAKASAVVHDEKTRESATSTATKR